MNAREELLRKISGSHGTLAVRCAYIYRSESWSEEPHRSILYTQYSGEEWEAFLKSLNYEYDSGYGLQEVYGTVWFTDGTWLEREEYDGAENWVYKKTPPIPIECFRPAYNN